RLPSSLPPWHPLQAAPHGGYSTVPFQGTMTGGEGPGTRPRGACIGTTTDRPFWVGAPRARHSRIRARARGPPNAHTGRANPRLFSETPSLRAFWDRIDPAALAAHRGEQ